MIVIKKIYFLFMSYMYIPMVVPNHSRVSRRHQLLSLNPLSLSNSRSSATAQKPVNFISHICGLGASVGCERVERTFNAPRLKAQIWLMKFTGFCAVAGENELNRGEGIWGQKLMYSAYSTMTGSRGYDLTCLYVIVK